MKFYSEGVKLMQKYLYLIFLVIGFIFSRSGLDKLEGGKFVGGLGATLTKMADKNPYPWYKGFLQSIAIPNSTLFGLLTMWGEILTGLSLVLISIYLLMNQRPSKMIYTVLLLAFATGMILNGVFWLAAGYTSPSTDGLNLVMFCVEAVGFFYTLNQLSTTKSK